MRHVLFVAAVAIALGGAVPAHAFPSANPCNLQSPDQAPGNDGAPDFSQGGVSIWVAQTPFLAIDSPGGYLSVDGTTGTLQLSSADGANQLWVNQTGEHCIWLNGTSFPPNPPTLPELPSVPVPSPPPVP